MNRLIKMNLVLVIASLVTLSSCSQASETPVENSVQSPTSTATTHGDDVVQLCEKLTAKVKEFKWKIEPCKDITWVASGKSVEGSPLIYAEFGNPQAKNTTLILSMVHPDEITPLFTGIQLAHWMKEHHSELNETRVVIAPLVNPDGLFRKKLTRMNARGVDINRNFMTKDWETQALKAWKTKYKSDPRRFPGSAPNSEPETAFQEFLIEKFQPRKILTIHAPLNHLDYDGPSALSLAKFPREYVRECLKLRSRLKAVSTGFFPGSLGNRAGQELGIPTITLELPSADPRKAPAYWKKFQSGIRSMIEFRIDAASLKEQNDHKSASLSPPVK